ncbi:transglutaminase-like putative cysteine protease [Spinactinospora alkalitolerans]|uniref:Transglutaminase-like putative cysteine protease n=1 Tax=Spinactinospora alkalitolerans TaxID=687207 RepID=A0A852TXY2_9ACTN|nr:DUF3488 and transglutaminase-like domain-containing protein [Spinactinospora alkalitolerans]NYE48631.1 transglutaminase-like putative cysteine protease [Spinactinospora alkalitolerans]
MKVRITLAAMATTLCALPLLHPLFADPGWWGGAVLAVVCVSATGLVCRAARLPGVLLPLTQALVVVTALNWMHASESALLGFVPTPDSIEAMRGLTGAGLAEIRFNPTPVRASEGVGLVTALCIGFLAILVDFAAVTLRAAALSGLALLALLFVPLSVHNEGIGWMAFALACAGYLLLLTVDGWDRASGWGIPVRPAAGPPGSRRRSADRGAGRHLFTSVRTAVLAVALALVLPMAAPWLVNDAVFALASGTRGNGETVATTHPLVTLRRDLTSPADRRVLEYQTSQARPEYLRMHVLDTFDGENWTMSPVQASPRDRLDDSPLPEPPGLWGSADDAATTEITVSSAAQRMDFLPLPYPARTVSVAGDWFVDPETLMVFSTRSEAGGLTYEVTAAAPDPDRGDLADAAPFSGTAVDERYLEVPEGMDPRVDALTESIVADASGPHARAVALQDWFTDGRFTYDLQPPGIPRGADPLPYFLFDSRIGYCEQFAAAMAVMARQAGIPARVAVGYTSGEEMPDGRWMVTERNAHAWPELYFEGHGWLRFEPTPSSSAGQDSANVPDYAVPAPVERPAPEGPADGDEPEEPAGEEEQEEQDPSATPGRAPEAQDTASEGAGSETGGPWPAVLVVCVAALLPAAPALVRLLVRRLRWSRAASAPARSRAAWLELRDDAVDLGIGWNPAESPRAVGRRLEARGRLPEPAREALRRIVAAEESARYAPVPGAAETLEEDGATVRAALHASCEPRARLLARLLPKSLFTAPTGRGPRHPRGAGVSAH